MPMTKGLVNLPGSSYATRKLVEELITKDATTHHAFFNPIGFHNHLSHHILAAYDLGAPAGLIQKIYDEEAGDQRPIVLEEKDKEIRVTAENWSKELGNDNAYHAFFAFFKTEIEQSGVEAALDRYIFSEAANEKGVEMLVRLVSGAVHPFIHVGYGLEFGLPILVAAGMAQAAIHTPRVSEIVSMINSRPGQDATKRTSSAQMSFLQALQEVYQSEKLKPASYDPNAFISARMKAAMSDGRAEEILRICSTLGLDGSLTGEELAATSQEIIWAATMLLFATGKKDRKPRLDFFLMHLVTSSIFIPSYLKTLTNPIHRANLLRAYIPTLILLMLSRGRPVINPKLFMSYTDKPRPPIVQDNTPRPATGRDALGNPHEDDKDYNPWPALISDSLYAHDSHVIKTMRTLAYAAREYGDVAPGEVIGAKGPTGEETMDGITEIDGSIFIRGAGMLMDYMGWVTHGQQARGDWDRSALGWDEAWDNKDD